ncbi:MAG: preprotein translocase subunit YajC [Chthoniobacteraceae bacterium]
MISNLAIVLAQTPTPPKAPDSGLGMLPMMLFLFAIMYFLMIRPQRKKQQELEKQLKALKTGDRVVTNGGIHGVIANVRGDDSTALTLKIAENVKIEIEKSAVATVLKDKTIEAKP